MLVMVAEADSVDRLQLVNVSIDVHVHAGYTLEAHMHLYSNIIRARFNVRMCSVVAYLNKMHDRIYYV